MRLRHQRLLLSPVCIFVIIIVLYCVLYSIHTSYLDIPHRYDQLVNSRRKNSFANEVLLMVRTGSSHIYKHLPTQIIHLETNYIPNLAFYSDAATKIGRHEIIDVVANESEHVRSTEGFQSYHNIHRLLSDSPRYEKEMGDKHLDIYKYIPALLHGHKNWPDMKWYYIMDENNFVFWDQVLDLISTLDHNRAYYAGTIQRGLPNYIHGGSGSIISLAAMKKFVAAESPEAFEQQWYNGDGRQYGGDVLVGEMMNNKGVKATALHGFYTNPYWKIDYTDYNLCLPVYTFHHMTSQDILDLSSFELEFKDCYPKGTIILLAHVFRKFVVPYLRESRTGWDNNAMGRVHILDRDNDDCSKYCEEWEDCLQYRIVNENCYLSSGVQLGKRSSDPNVFSGWHLERIAAMRDSTSCDGSNMI